MRAYFTRRGLGQNVPPKIAGALILLALFITGAYKIAKAYRRGMDRSKSTTT